MATPSSAKRLIKKAFAARSPLCFWGPPGVGKSEVFYQTSQELDVGLVDLRLTNMDVVEVRGLPRMGEDDICYWSRPSFLPTEGTGILFLDEITATNQAMQVAIYQLVNEHRIGDHILPDGWVVFGAGNRAEDRSVVQKMSKALGNRFTHIDFLHSVKDWDEWAIGAGINPMVVAWIRFKNEALFDFDPQSPENAFAAPRSWVKLGRLLDQDLDPQDVHEVCVGTVGKGQGTEFWGFTKMHKDLPSIDSILAAPETTVVPEDLSAKYAILTTLARRVSKKIFGQIVKYGSRFPDEFQVLLIRDCIRCNNQEVKTCDDFLPWLRKHQEVIL